MKWVIGFAYVCIEFYYDRIRMQLIFLVTLEPIA